MMIENKTDDADSQVENVKHDFSSAMIVAEAELVNSMSISDGSTSTTSMPHWTPPVFHVLIP
jgi:hypothetical protein